MKNTLKIQDFAKSENWNDEKVIHTNLLKTYLQVSSHFL